MTIAIKAVVKMTEKKESNEMNETLNMGIALKVKVIWRWTLRIWLILFIPVGILMTVVGFDNFTISAYIMVSFFLFITYPSIKEESDISGREARMLEIFVSRSENPSASFEEYIIKLRNSGRIGNNELQELLIQFTSRSDEVGAKAREMIG